MTASTIETLPGAETAIVEPERRASWLELFFDLCFVVAVGAVAQTLHGNPSVDGVVLFAALFIPVWWSWMEYAWYATSFDDNSVFNRFAALLAMLAILTMAAQVGSAAAGNIVGFIVAFALFHFLVSLLFLRTIRFDPGRRAFALRYAVGFASAGGLWLLSLVAPTSLLIWFWTLALVIDLATPIEAVRHASQRMFDVRHIPERYGLFTIIVLGEAIIAVARGTAESDWTLPAVTAAVSGFVIAAVIWWAYFAHPEAELLSRGLVPAFIWGYGHVFVWAGIAMMGVGIEFAIEAATNGPGFPTGERLILCGGLALYLAAMALLRAVDAGRLTDPIALGRLATVAAGLALGIVGGALPPEILTAVVAIVLVAAGFLIGFAWRRAPATTA